MRPRFRNTVLFTSLALALGVAAGASQGLAQETAPPPIVLGSPVDCAIPEVCWVQNYYDHDPGPAAEDHTCGRRAYDRHRGIDVRVANLKVMAEGIPVVASADGVVAGIRDGMPDTGIIDADRASVRGRECGNGVAVRHEGGWITQYCHLRRGSISVAKGQPVAKGDQLGEIGLSGLTEFPHVHLEVRHGKRSIDPFVGVEATGKCGTVGTPLFETAFLEKTPYVETGLLNAGFTDQPPKGVEVLRGEHVNPTLAVDAPALIYWVELFGTQPGDRFQFTVFAPDGRPIVQNTFPPQESHSARSLKFSGLKRPPTGWQPGTYRGVFQLLRDEVGETKVAFELEKTVVVGNAQDAAAAAPARQGATTPPAAPTAPAPATPEASPGPTATPAPTTAGAADMPGPTPTARGTAPPSETTQDTGFSVAAIAERASRFIPGSFSNFFEAPAGNKGPPIWLVAVGLFAVIVGMAGVAYITRH